MSQGNTTPVIERPDGLPPVGSLWRDREGIIWRLVRYIDHSSWVSLTAVDHPTWRWHADPIIDLRPPKAERVNA